MKCDACCRPHLDSVDSANTPRPSPETLDRVALKRPWAGARADHNPCGNAHTNIDLHTRTLCGGLHSQRAFAAYIQHITRRTHETPIALHRRITFVAIGLLGCAAAEELGARALSVPLWEVDNPILPLPTSPLGIDDKLTDCQSRRHQSESVSAAGCSTTNGFRPTARLPAQAATVRNTRFLNRLRYRLEFADRKGGRKAPSFINQAWALNPRSSGMAARSRSKSKRSARWRIRFEMGHTHAAILRRSRPTATLRSLNRRSGLKITNGRMAKAIADYERTRLSGNSPWDRWKRGGDENAVAEEVKKGDALFFFGKAACSQCHLGQNFADGLFHNVGVGWDPTTDVQGRRPLRGDQG